MAKTPEEKAVDSLTDNCSKITFLPRIFGSMLVSCDKSEQQAVFRAFLGFVECLAEKWENVEYDERNKAACEIAYEMRNWLHDHHGWPVEIPMI